ncbi:MAG: hypothetical protein Q8889_02550 [Candidatus Phytoplasma australasiaticum]|nr:hypothetical protein [Candidatus Phytoplasma australasiaticum]MDV3199981.1 hypothetical protein [Candidatus Phytoplasma australasiaticum]
MIKLKQKLFLLQFFLFSFLILLFTINNKVIAMYPDNPGTSNSSLTEDHMTIDEKILKFKDTLEIHKEIIMIINELIQRLPDENIKKNMLYELQESLTQLINFAINHNPVKVTNINDSGTNDIFSTQSLIMDQILKIKYFIETHKHIIIDLEKTMQKLPNGKSKKYILCELYNFLIQSFDDNKKELQIQEILLKLIL